MITTNKNEFNNSKKLNETGIRAICGKVVYVQPGDVYITSADECISTVLGSCIAVCMLDPQKNIGGMNHFMLAKTPANSPNSLSFITTNAGRYGMAAMENLINGIVKKGGNKSRLLAKVFGGAAMFNSSIGTNVGKANIDFVLWFLQQENIKITAKDIGGNQSRRIFFKPREDKVILKRIKITAADADQGVKKEEEKYFQQLNIKSNQPMPTTVANASYTVF